MQLNGYDIREAIKRWERRKEVADKQFKDSLWVFEDEDKPLPQKVAEDFRNANHSVSLLKAFQQDYNHKVSVKVLGEEMTLSLAVNLLGGVGHLEKMYSLAATDTGKDRYSSRTTVRTKDEVAAKRQLSQKEASHLSDETAKYASALRAAIAQGNATRTEYNCSPDLFK